MVTLSTAEPNQQADLLIVNDDLWTGFSESDEYKAFREDFKDSYIWDRLIEHYTDDLLSNGMFDMHSKKVTDNELALVEMALQPRNYRAVLADAFMEFLQQPELKVASRTIRAYGNTAFVFLLGKSAGRDNRARELVLRCLVVRGRMPGVTTVVGIATDRPGTSEIGYSSDIAYIHLSEWTDENEAHVDGIQADLGYFQHVQWSALQ